MIKTTERFSDRVANYIKYRPSYPQAVVDTLISECKLADQATVADIGSGTGIFSQLLLDKGLHVFGVEPNEDMRKAAEHQLSGYEYFSSVEGQSECTTLADSSVDLITAAQAFHWFKGAESRQEFSRILRPAGYLALIWNQRKIDQPFQKEYDGMLRNYATDYNAVNHMNLTDEDIESFVCPGQVVAFNFKNSQYLDLAGFLGRMQSSSYTPKINTMEHETLMKVASELFSRYARNGSIAFEYDTRLYLAQLSG